MAYLKENESDKEEYFTVEEPDKRTAEELAYCSAKFFEGISVEELDLCSRYILTILVTLHRHKVHTVPHACSNCIGPCLEWQRSRPRAQQKQQDPRFQPP